MKVTRKGFTLIELLIVMVIIAILAGVMLIASMEIQATANVTKVINDMEVMKRAILACCYDQPDKYPNPPDCDPPSIVEVKRYLGNSSMIDDDGKDNNVESSNWSIGVQNKGSTDINKPAMWYLIYKMPQHMTDSYSFRKKMQDRAKAHMFFRSMEPDISDAVKHDRFYKAKAPEGSNKGQETLYLPLFI